MFEAISWPVGVSAHANRRYSSIEWEYKWMLAARRLKGDIERVDDGRSWEDSGCLAEMTMWPWAGWPVLLVLCVGRRQEL